MSNDNTASSDMHVDDSDGIYFQTASGQTYFISKNDRPNVKNIGLADTQFSQSVFSKQEFTALNNKSVIAEIYKYLTGKPLDSDITVMINAISFSLNQTSSKVFPIQKNSDLYTKIDTNPTGKTDTVTEEGVKQNEIIPELVQIIPVRYALDESQLIFKDGAKEHSIVKDPEQWIERHNLPKKGKFEGGLFKGAFTRNKYTLRQLTDGWLYVWDDGDGQKLDEYKVEGTQLILCDGSRNAGTTGNVYLEYPSTSILRIVFSHIKWSDRLFNEYKDSTSEVAKIRRKWGREVICSFYNGKHTGLFEDVINDIADIGVDGKAIFPLAIPSIADRKIDDENTITGKPIQTVDTYRGALSDPTTARLVALDDPFSDVNDLVSQVNYLQGLLYEVNDIELSKRITAKAAVSFCYESIKNLFPGNVTFETEKQFKKDLNKFHEDYASVPLSIGAIHTPAHKELVYNFIKKYNVSPYAAYETTSRMQYIDGDAAYEFLYSHIKHDRGIYKLIKEIVQELMGSHDKIKPDPSFLGVDKFDPEGQGILMGWMLNTFDCCNIPGLNENILAKLSDELFVKDKCKSLIGLTFSAFDNDFRTQYLSIISNLSDDRELTDIIKDDLEQNTSDPGLTETQRISIAISSYKRLDKLIKVFKEHNIERNSWVDGLVSPAAKSFAALRKAIHSISTEAWLALDSHEMALFAKAKGKLSSKLALGNVIRNSYLDPTAGKGIVVNYIGAQAIPETIDEADNFIKFWTEKLKNNLANGEDVIPKHMIISSADKAAEAAHIAAVKKQVENLMSKTGELATNGIVYSILALNIWNVNETPIPAKWDFTFNNKNDGKETYKIISNYAYLAQSLIGLFHSPSKKLMGVISKSNEQFDSVLTANQRLKEVMAKRVAEDVDVIFGEGKGKTIISDIKKFRQLSLAMSVVTGIAGGTNAVIYTNQYINASKNGLNTMETNLTGVLAVTSTLQGIEGAVYLFQVFAVVETAAWVTPFFFVVGAVSLITSLVLTYITRDDVDKWLQHSRFGLKPALRLWEQKYDNQSAGNKAILAELRALLHVTLAPTIFTQSAFEIEAFSSYKGTYSKINGYFVILSLPGLSTEWEVKVGENSDDLCINNSHLDVKPHYITPEQFNDMRNGIPTKYREHTSNESHIVTGLYLFYFPLQQEFNSLSLKLTRKLDKNPYYYIIQDINSGSVIPQDKSSFDDTDFTSLSLLPIKEPSNKLISQ